MNVAFRLNEDGEYDRLLRLNELKCGDIFKLRKEDGTFLTENGIQTQHFVCVKPNYEITEDFRYGVQGCALLIFWAAVYKLNNYFCEHFAVNDYAFLPEDMLNLCFDDSYDVGGWKVEEFPKFVSLLTSEEQRAKRDAWWKYAIPALKIDNELYIKSKAS